MGMVFSPLTGAFYNGDLRDAYDAAGTWPADAVDVADDVWQEFIAAPPTGKVRGVAAGAPAWVDVFRLRLRVVDRSGTAW